MNDMSTGMEAGDLAAHMDTTDDLVPTLEVKKFIYLEFAIFKIPKCDTVAFVFYIAGRRAIK